MWTNRKHTWTYVTPRSSFYMLEWCVEVATSFLRKDVMAWNEIWTFEQPNTGSIYGDDPRRRSCALLISQYLMIKTRLFFKPSTTPVTQRALPHFQMIRSDFCHGRLALWMPGRLSGRRSRCVVGSGGDWAMSPLVGLNQHRWNTGFPRCYPSGVTHQSDPWNPWPWQEGLTFMTKKMMVLMDQPPSTRTSVTVFSFRVAMTRFGRAATRTTIRVSCRFTGFTAQVTEDMLCIYILYTYTLVYIIWYMYIYMV